MEKHKGQNHPKILFIKWALFLKNSKNAEWRLKLIRKREMIKPVKKIR